MIAPAFTVTFCTLWVLLLVRHADRASRYLLGLATLYAFAGESVAVRLGQYYYDPSYWPFFPSSTPGPNDFILRAFGAAYVASPSWATPVGIVALESTILFSLVRTTGGTAALRPLLSGALAVNMDAILDPIAVPVLWHWQVSGPWFGIPLSNYSAWFLSVAAFSAGLQIAPPLTGIGAAAIAFGVCAGCFLMSFLIYKFSALAALLFVSALPLLRARRQPTRTARSPLVAVFALCLIVMVLTRAGGRYWLVWAITASIQALYFWRMARLRDESSHPQPSRTRSKAFTA